MSKQVLVISSSPRRGGNSDTLSNQFINGAESSGHQIEKVFLKDKKVNYCTGCGICYNGEKSCSQKDDMAELLKKMISSDVIVMSTPIYFYAMCSQMKTFIDRCCARYNEISNKEFYFILTAADNNKQSMHRTVEEFRGFTECLENSKEKGIIYGTGAWKVGDIKDSKAMDLAFEMGKSI